MPLTVNHAFTSPIADGTNTQLVRPSNWNANHLATYNAAGSEIIGAFSNANGFSFGLSGTAVTGSYTVPTQTVDTNKAGTGFTSTTTAGTAIVGTLNTDGLSLGVPAYLTTAQPVGAYLTTAAQSNHSHNFATTTTNGALIVVGTTNSNGATIGVPAFLTTAAATNVTTNNMATSERNNYFYTSNNTLANSTHSHGAVAFSGTNVSGSFTSASNGLSINLSAGAGGAGDGYNIIAAGGSTANSTGTILFSNSNGVSFGLNGATVTASHNGLTTAAQSNHSHGNPTLALTNLSGTTASASNGLTISLSAAAPGGGGGAGTNTALNLTNLTGTLSANTNGISLSLSAAAPGGGAAKNQYWAVPNLFPGPMGLMTNLTGTAVSHRLLLFPFQVEGNLTCQELMWYMSRAATGSDLFTVSHGFYSFVNSSSIGLVSSASGVYSNTNTAGNSGIRIWEAFPAATTLSQGDYVLGMHFSGAATASMNFSLMGYSTSNLAVAGIVHTGTDNTLTHLSHQLIPFWGRYSVTTNAMPSGVNMTGVQGLGTNALPLYFYLGTHN